jgi:pectin methylesterase-like acyl-CoA thioesterase
MSLDRLFSRPALLGLLALCSLPGPTRAETPTAARLAPAPGATGVCVDTPLRLTFDRAPRVGNKGTIRVERTDGTLADVIDLADPSSSKRSIGGARLNQAPYAWNYHPVLVDGTSAFITLHRPLDYGQTYTVTISPDVLTDAEGRPFPGIADASAWRFSTRPAPPAAGTGHLTVAADGTGDFSTLQGAIDLVPPGNKERVFILVRSGTYREIVYIRADKPLITVYGEDRDRTVIQYANNNKFNTGNFRVMFGVDAPDFTLTRITLHNTTPYRGSQAEAFRCNNQRVLLDHVTLKSFQDTVFMQGKALVNACDIEGDVDFLWGSGTVFFQDCELRMVHSKGYYTQVRNKEGVPGYVFRDCRLTRSGDDIQGAYLSRIDPNVFPYSQVVFLNTAMGPHIRPEGWLLNNAGTAPHVQFWEYGSTDLDGRPLDVSRRAPFSRQLTAEEAGKWSDPASVLGGWVPDLKVLLPEGGD